MNYLSAIFFHVSLTAVILFASGCGGGGGGSSSSSPVGGDPVTAQEDKLPGEKMLSFEADIEPIMQAKCQGCHNSGGNPLAPFSLEGIDLVNSFKSAIQFTLETNTMPPAGAQQLTISEHAKLIAWLTDQPYNYTPELRRIALVKPVAWDVQPKKSDVFLAHRPDEVDCPRDSGWLVEEDALEVRTEFCNYLSLSQDSPLELEAGTELELVLSHSALNFNAPATAHFAVSIGGSAIWETTIDIPSDNALRKEKLVLPFAVQRGDSIEIHGHNHGDNAWTIHSLEALVSSDDELTFCPTFDSTFEAIQATVFEQGGCANSLCHGAAVAGGLDLTPANAWDNLVDAAAVGSSLTLVNPRKPAVSYLYHKLSAKTLPGSYDIAGSAMPSAGQAISAGQLEAIRLWIEAGAPKEGSVGDTLGRGEDEIERLLGVCLPEADAVNTVPLPAPAPDKGIQFAMPPQDVPAESEREVCFAVYEDFRDVIPEEFLSEDRETFFTSGGENREDAFTHHNLIYKSPVGVDEIHDPSFGEWTCGGGEQDGESCEPTDLSSCGTGKCRAEMQDSIACRGYGPPGVATGQGTLGLSPGIERDGFYSEFPSHGLFYWNSHAFNLTTEDGVLRVWRNIDFAQDRRFRAKSLSNGTGLTGNIFIATGIPPFEKETLCRDYNFDQGDGLLYLSSHTHKRGERFFMSVGDEEVYETFTYDEPLQKYFEPALVFNSPDPTERVLEHCATYNNGVNDDGSPNIETVVRLSRRPINARDCKPTACVQGNIGGSCNGEDDDASCDSSPGADDGWCDACAISGAFSSDDEMFILIGAKLADHDQLINIPPPVTPEVTIVQPTDGDVFSAGDLLDLEFYFKHFSLMPPEEHSHDDAYTDHNDAEGDHESVTAGHYHVYLDTGDDDADHITAWTESLKFALPENLAPGAHVIRISLRAPDHHAVGVEDSISIQVE